MFKFLRIIIPKSVKKRIIQFFDYFNKTKNLQIQIDQLHSILLLKEKISIPPKNLQIRVAGAYFSDFFIQGNTLIKDIENTLSLIKKDLKSFNKILDFGCGCGRFLIPLSFKLNPKKLYGTDIDEEAIKWFNSNYNSFADLAVNPVLPPTKYSDNTFDFIYSISIFTHLPEDMQFAWLKELRRITKSKGYLILTTHGENCYKNFSPKVLKKIKEIGFYYIGYRSLRTEGLPEFYQSAYHSVDYIKRVWSEYFKIIDIKPAGMGMNQDLILLQKK